MIQLPLFQPTTPHGIEVFNALRDAFTMWHKHATDIKPELTGAQFPVTFDDGMKVIVTIKATRQGGR